MLDQEGIKALLRRAGEQFPRLSHLWVDAGYRGEDKGADWVRKTLGWSVELVERPKKPAPDKVLMVWAKEGVAVDWRKLLQHQLALSCSGASILVSFKPHFERLFITFAPQ